MTEFETSTLALRSALLTRAGRAVFFTARPKALTRGELDE